MIATLLQILNIIMYLLIGLLIWLLIINPLRKIIFKKKEDGSYIDKLLREVGEENKRKKEEGEKLLKKFSEKKIS